MKLNLLKFLCLVGMLIMLVGCSEDGLAILTIVNQSEETIVLLQVAVNEDIQTVNDLKHGEEAELRFLVKRDADYHIDIEFLSGRTIKDEVGYLTRRTNISDMVIINETDITFETISVETHELY